MLRWTALQSSFVLLLCLIVAGASSLPWLLKPDLQPGALAPFNAIAPKDALVQDSTALEQRRSTLVARSVVQVLDQEQTQALKLRLERQLSELQQVSESGSAARVGPVNLSADEQVWLEQRSNEEHLAWDNVVRQAANRMLSQGLVSTLAVDQFRQAANFQLQGDAIHNPAARSLAGKLLASSLQGSSNLRTDPILSKQLIEEQLTKQGIPTIDVRKGDLITRKGEPISPQAYDVLDFFGKVKREPQPLIWLGRFLEALAACGVMLLVMRRERPGLEVRHALLALGLLLLAQVAKLWFQSTVSPLAVLVPPTLILTEGLGRLWPGLDGDTALIWPLPPMDCDGRLLIAVVATTGGCCWSSAQSGSVASTRCFAAARRALWPVDPASAPTGDGMAAVGMLNPGLDELARIPCYWVSC